MAVLNAISLVTINLIFIYLIKDMGDEEDELQSKTPLKVSNLNFESKVFQIVCGGMHTLILTTLGKVFSFGCSDDGSLGRQGPEKVPALVEEINIPINCIAAGDVHSIAYSTQLNELYYWGVYRVN